jgi:PAS domain S-box-containing protein
MDSQVINVLSIEDNPGDALLIQERLIGIEPAGWGRPQFELEWVDTLTEGLTRLSDAASGKAKRIDAVLTDLDLPDSQAGETFTILREHFPHLPIVVLTGREDEELAIQSVRAGAQDYLFKAEATSALLAHAITYAIEREQAKEALEKAHAEAKAILKERVEARTAELAKAKQFSDSLIDAMADGFSVLDKDGVHIRVNPALCEMVGFTEAELIGHHPLTLYWPEEELDAIQDAFEKTARGEFKDFYLTLKRKNGERFPCIVSPSWIRDEKGEVISYFATVKDITEQKKAEEALRQSEERFRTIVNELPQFIAYTDKDLKYQFVNQTYQEKFGLEPDEVLGKPLPEVIGEKAFEKARVHVEKALHGERVRYHERYDYAIGETRDVDGILIPDIAEDGEVRGYYAVLTDITPYIAMQEALEESEERFRMTVYRAPIGVGIVDSTGQMTDCNPALAEMVGYTREALLHMNFADFTHPDDLEREWQLIEALWEEKTTEYRMEKRYIHKDGHIIWVDVAASLFKGENKALEFGFAFVQDITERKRTEKALQKSEALLRIVIDTDPNCIFVKNQAGVYLLANRAIAQLYGTTPEAMVGQTDLAFADISQLKPDEAANFLANDRAVIDSGQAKFIPEEPFTLPDGTTRWFQTTKIPLSEGNYPDCMLGIAVDITARKQTKEALARSEKLLASTFDALQDLLIVIDPNLRIVMSNWKGHTYIPEEERQGHPYCYKSLMHRDKPCEPCPAMQVFKTGQVQEYEDINPVDGRLRNVRIYPVFDADHEVTMVVEHVRDVTDRRQAEEALEHYAIELQRSNEDLQQFAYTISHDLREPLRMVKGYLTLLAQRYRGQLDDKANQFIHFAVDGAERMETLIQDLLKYARVDTQGKALSPTDAEAILTRVLHSLHFKIVEVGAEVTHDPLPTMLADETQLTQVFQNLIGNALKFSERRSNPTSQPQIHISAEAQEETWLFSVADNGIGIAPKHHKRIFGVFQRLHTREEYEGTGIGLAICKKIVERHGGQIWVESELGKGATFYFTIPR